MIRSTYNFLNAFSNTTSKLNTTIRTITYITFSIHI